MVAGLRSFHPDPTDNPGRLNVYRLGDVTVILDLAHNEDSLRALLEVARGIVRPGGRLRLLLGTAGDRTDEILQALSEIASHGADDVVLVEKLSYLRGRDRAEMLDLLRSGLHDRAVAAYADEPAALLAALEAAHAGDVIAVMTHEQRADLDALIRGRGGGPA
jgi:cyanophycin synthetase